jgi:predicted dehydrogenase
VTGPFADVRPARVGIVGCGNVIDLYLPACARFPSIEFAACADLDPARAAALSASAGFPALPVEALLADPSIEIVLILTPPGAHAAVSRAAIAAGKHVYSEKPLAIVREDAQAILAEAEAAGVRLGGAPDTFLGGGLQTARAVLDAGGIGEVGVASATVAHLGPELWHPNPAFFYGPGGGPLLDVGPYYVTALVHLLGPIVEVTAVARGVGGERTIARGPRAGQTFPVTAPTTIIGAFTFSSGAIASITASFDVAASTQPHIELHGTAGSLSIGDPNTFDGPVRRHAVDGAGWTDVPLTGDGTVGRGIGLADMIEAIRLGRPARASGALAFHVVDVLLSTEAAAASGAPVRIESTVARPEPLPPMIDADRPAA